MLVRSLLGIAVLIALGIASACAQEADPGNTEAVSYRIVTEKDSSFSKVRRRVTLEIEIDGADDPTSRTTTETMMRAVTEWYPLDQPDAVSVRLWRFYGDGSYAKSRIVYAPDGCGWSGSNCTGELWTSLLRGEIPY